MAATKDMIKAKEFANISMKPFTRGGGVGCVSSTEKENPTGMIEIVMKPESA